MALEQVPGCPFYNPRDCPFSKGGSVWHDKAGLCVKPDDPAVLQFHQAFHARLSNHGSLSADAQSHFQPPDIIPMQTHTQLEKPAAKPTTEKPPEPPKQAQLAEEPQIPKALVPSSHTETGLKGEEHQKKDAQEDIMAENAHLKQALDEMHAVIDDMRRQKSAAEQALKQALANHEMEIKREQKRHQEDLAASQAAVDALQHDNHALSGQLSSSVEAQARAEEEKEKLHRTLKEAQATIENLNQRQKLLEKQLADLQKEKAEMTAERGQLQNALQAAQATVSCLQKEHLDLGEQLNHHQLKGASLESQAHAQNTQIQEALMQEQAKCKKLLNEKQELCEQLSQKQKEVAEAKAQVEATALEKTRHVEQLYEIQGVLREQTDKLRNVEEERQKQLAEALEVERCRWKSETDAKWERQQERHSHIVDAMQQRLDDMRRRLAELEPFVNPRVVRQAQLEEHPMIQDYASSLEKCGESIPLIDHPRLGPGYAPSRRDDASERLEQLQPGDFGAVPITFGYLMAMKAAFQLADVDQTGFLDVVNLGQYCAQRGLKEVSYGQLMQMIDAADPSGTGMIDFFGFLGIQVYMAFNLKARCVYLSDWMAFCTFGEIPRSVQLQDLSLDAVESCSGRSPEAPTFRSSRRSSSRMRMTLQQHLVNAAAINA